MIRVTLTDNNVKTISQALQIILTRKQKEIKTMRKSLLAEPGEEQAHLIANYIDKIQSGVTEIETIIIKLNNAEEI